MKPPEEVKREFLRQWLEKAEGDWSLSHRLLSDPEPPTEAIAFHAQQAVEKYLKAFLTWHQVEFPKTHDIKRLLGLAGSCDQVLAESLSNAASLTAYAVEYRYPGEYPSVTADDAANAVMLADLARDQVRRRLPASKTGEEGNDC
jgi:HEPN domain-containing protein